MQRVLMAMALCLVAAMLAAQVVVPSASSETRQLKQKAEAGDADAQLTLARAYENGEGVPQSDERAVKWYRAAAEQGNAAAQNGLGVMYRLGHGVEKDYAQARQWYEKAAKQKLSAALFNLGTLYYNGDGVAIDDIRAYAYFALAQEAGSTEGAQALQRMNTELSPPKLKAARLFLGEFLEREQGEPQWALKVYERLAQEGDGIAPIRAAKIFLDGKGVAQDVGRARDFCELAARQNFTPGMVCLGYLYQSGALGSADFANALNWYDKAAAKGNPVAMYSLGVMYAKGTGVKQDDSKAYAWFAKAARGRIPLAASAMEVLRPKLSKGKLAEASREAFKAFVLPINMYPEIAEFGRALKLD